MSGTTFLSTNGIASGIFNLSGPEGPKQKHIFSIRFYRASTPLGASPAAVQQLSYLVKSVDRPTITVTTEELNEYNKKRQVITGWKAGPTKVVFYDTADGLAMQMFDQYARYYFGDFGQTNNGSGKPLQGWVYDATNQTFNDTGSGFGFTASNAGSKKSDDQFFFDRCDIIHVGAAGYSLLTLVNPRISEFMFDELNYEDAEVATVTATLVSEGILMNGGPMTSALAQTFFGESALTTGFAPNPSTLNVPPNFPLPSVPAWTDGSAPESPLTVNQSTSNALPATGSTTTASTTGGVLSSFGNFSFGASLNLSALTRGKASLASVLNINASANLSASGLLARVGLSGGAGGITAGVSGGINASAWQIAAAGLQGNGAGGASSTASGAAVSMAQAQAAAAITGSPTASVGPSGVTPTAQQVAIMNANNGSGTSAVGTNSGTTSTTAQTSTAKAIQQANALASYGGTTAGAATSTTPATSAANPADNSGGASTGTPDYSDDSSAA